MFNNIGRKIKVLAAVFCWIGIILSVIGGIVAWVAADDEIGGLLFLAIAAIGSLLSWIGSFVLYGFGELVDKVSNIETVINNSGTKNKSSVKNQVVFNTQNRDEGEPANYFLGDCEMCDKTEIPVCNAKIVDNMGTRYRKVCKDCFKKYNCDFK